ncbi:pantothenate transporter liz1 [Plectosphaerella cucumerina]|uniref:Pantothenate transporter liz1 n=1 Tax=Plectosphaerella cucumerina TaxID=40658 RepID=A0A8K0TC22_9PEZI|nr:pantothenate transporter liz1 [Plectosphaerella cucumerina]
MASEKLQQPGSAVGEPSEDLPEVRENAWIRFMTFLHWYPKDMPSFEKRLVLKLDLMILVYGCLCFFTKYLDQASLTNAYVTGMREELKMFGNEFNYAVITFWSSYCVFMIPACYYLTRYPVNVVLPLCELGWGVATFGLAWAQNVQTIYAMRFFVGLFEACSFTGVIYVIGSWMRKGEIGRRVALFYTAAPLGTMFAGYLQTAAYRGLTGVGGLAGWRWLFIVAAIITIPISFLGYFVFPDVPSRSRPRCLTVEEHRYAQDRIAGQTAPPQLKVSRDIFARVFRRWHWYLFVALWSIGNQNSQISGSPFSLYLKANQDIYSITRINTLPTIATAVSVVTAFTTCAIADRIGRFWPLLLAVSFPTVIAHALLVAWHVGEAGRLAAFTIAGFEGALFPLSMAWATVTMANDAEERAVVTASMNAIGQAIVAWSQLLQFPAVKAPRFINGFLGGLITSVLQFIVILVIVWFAHRQRKNESNGTLSEPTEEVAETIFDKKGGDEKTAV